MDWLYRKDNNEKVCCWCIEKINDKYYKIKYGRLNGNIREDIVLVTQKDVNKEIESKYKEKRKQGYKSLNEVRDDAPPFDNQTILQYLEAYLPSYRNNENNGNILPMLAKSYTGRFWKYNTIGKGQYKINGLRCVVTAYVEQDIFSNIRLKFQSREGIVWDTLRELELILLDSIPNKLLEDMIYNGVALDGEVYLPGYDINEINHIVKDDSDYRNKLLQFWCYDIAILDMPQNVRDAIRHDMLSKFIVDFKSIDEHLSNTQQLIVLPEFDITNDEQTVSYRDKFINLGFEGLILRNPTADYQFGRRRVGYMEKYKDKTDGKFIIIDIQPERKRDLPIITCRNDINDGIFETKFSYPQEKQKLILANRDKYIGKYVFISFGERSGVSRVPFHIKEVYLLDANI